METDLWLVRWKFGVKPSFLECRMFWRNLTVHDGTRGLQRGPELNGQTGIWRDRRRSSVRSPRPSPTDGSRPIRLGTFERYQDRRWLLERKDSCVNLMERTGQNVDSFRVVGRERLSYAHLHHVWGRSSRSTGRLLVYVRRCSRILRFWC